MRKGESKPTVGIRKETFLCSSLPTTQGVATTSLQSQGPGLLQHSLQDILPIYGHSHKHYQPASLDSDRKACSFPWCGCGNGGGSLGPTIDRTRGRMGRAVGGGILFPVVSQAQRFGSCFCSGPFRISCHSARAYIQLRVANVTATPGFAIFPV